MLWLNECKWHDYFLYVFLCLKKLHFPCKSEIFCDKVICLISKFAFYDNYQEILKDFYIIQTKNQKPPIERWICNLIDEVPLCYRGALDIKYETKIKKKKKSYIFHIPLNYFMISGKNIINLFRCLTIDNIIELFKLAMLEQKIIVISKYPALLN